MITSAFAIGIRSSGRFFTIVLRKIIIIWFSKTPKQLIMIVVDWTYVELSCSSRVLTLAAAEAEVLRAHRLS